MSLLDYYLSVFHLFKLTLYVVEPEHYFFLLLVILQRFNGTKCISKLRPGLKSPRGTVLSASVERV